jgi:uncharacterized membrane protein HdeD (DUF308 family)
METKPMKSRWFLALNGIIAILFGLMMVIYTQDVIQTIVFYAGLLMTFGGVCFLFLSIYYLKKDKKAGMLVLQAIFSIAIGLGFMIFKENSLQMFFLLLGVWAIIIGIFQLVILINTKKNLSNKNFILFNGLLIIAFGILLIIEKNELPVILAKVLGVFLTLFGIIMIYLSFVIRKSEKLADNES